MLKLIKLFTDFIKTRSLVVICGYCAFVLVLNIYLFSKYNLRSPAIEKIAVSSDINRESFSLYVMPEFGGEVDYTKAVKAVAENGEYTFKISGPVRNFRIYIETGNAQASLKNLRLIYKDKNEAIKFSSMRLNDIHVLHRGDVELNISNQPNCYLELKYEMIYPVELIYAEVLILIAGFLFCFLTIITFHEILNFTDKKANLKVISVSVFLASIFLPHPLFNVTFILSFLLLLRDFTYRKFINTRVGLLFLFFFILFIFNSIVISHTFNHMFFETMLPFLFLPFYFACIPQSTPLKIFPVISILVTLCLLTAALVDTVIYRDVAAFSFDAFSKYLHPVYFSYLLFFSICFLVLRSDSGIRKSTALLILIIGLICCGSKLVISLTIFFLAIRLIKKKAVMGWSVIAAIILSVLLFKPTRERFTEIFDLRNLSILNDRPVKNIHDARLNGLTLRLIIWQESLQSVKSVSEFIFGKGVDKQAESFLEQKLTDRGLESGHTHYDPHNQFIATFYKMGLLGFGILIALCVNLFYKAYKRRNQLLFYTTLLFTLAMCTESVLQRVVGIYFFICILLLLSDPIINPSHHIENSYTGNKRHS